MAYTCLVKSEAPVSAQQRIKILMYKLGGGLIFTIILLAGS